MVVSHCFAADFGTFRSLGTGRQIEVIHGDQNTALGGFESISDIGNRPTDDNAHGVGQITVLHAELVFKRDETKKCKVIDDRKVVYEGEEFLLVDLAVKLLHGLGIDTQSEDVRAPKEFTYNGELLSERRVRLTSE